MKSLAWLAVGVSLVTALGYAFLLASPNLAIAGCILIGLGQATTFPMSLSFISTRAANHVQTTQLSTLAQGIGYLIAATFTFAIGALREASGSWTSGLLLVLVATCVQTVAGFIAGRPGHIQAAK
jgi:CP family cyanate transporter-like MFS transporter